MPRNDTVRRAADPRGARLAADKPRYRVDTPPAETALSRSQDTYGCVDWFDYGRAAARASRNTASTAATCDALGAETSSSA